jgi:hypothetical protein
MSKVHGLATSLDQRFLPTHSHQSTLVISDSWQMTGKQFPVFSILRSWRADRLTKAHL